MKKRLNSQQFHGILTEISRTYDVYAPVSFEGKGMFSDLPLVRYDKITDLAQAEFEEKSFYSPKEAVIPITQRLFYFNEAGYHEPPLEDVKPALILLRSCDLYAFDRLDSIYLKNKFSDKYYAQARAKVKFALVGCHKSWETCFCVSMGTNRATHYDLGLNIEPNGDIYVHVQDESFQPLFKTAGEDAGFQVKYVTENVEKVRIAPNISLKETIDLPLWRDYDRCIGCGRCNFVCPTCSCYSAQDVFYKDNPNQGERRRVWASCHVDGFTSMAGGHEFRPKKGDRMRFKVMHKVSDYARRFGVNMCVGCGRCDTACPEYISYINSINKLTAEVEKNRAEAQHG